MRFSDIFESEPGSVSLAEWVWCPDCERVHKRQDWEDRDLSCPSPNCDGAGLDAIPWEDVCERHPEYPQVPQAGARYPNV